MTIKNVFDEISSEGGSNMKMEILRKYVDNKTLERVLYLANSKRVKFYIKQIPEYTITDEINSEHLSWALHRMGILSQGEIRGHRAIEWVKDTLESISEDDVYIIERIIEKDCKIGMGTSNINKVFDGLIEKTPYMGAKPYTEKLARDLFNGGDGVFSDIKMDGRYQNAIIRPGEVELVSRQGEITPVGDALFLKELNNFPDNVVLNGELTIDGLDRYTANGIVASIVDIEGKREIRGHSATVKKITAFGKKHGDYFSYMNRIVYTVWDMITIDEYFKKGTKIKSTVPYESRRNNLALTIQNENSQMTRLVESKIAYTYEEAVKHFQEALSRGLEGTIIKSRKGDWKDGKPNWQVKMKLEINVDLRIVAFNYGTGKNSDVISSLTCESECGRLKTRPTGIKEDMMQHITENQDDLMNSILEMKSCGISQDSDGNYSMLHPVFKVLRDDKDMADTLEQIIKIENASKQLS